MIYHCCECGLPLAENDAGEVLCVGCRPYVSDFATSSGVADRTKKAVVNPTAPFTVAIDTREQLPYTFTGLKSDAVAGCRPLVVPTSRLTLPAGDYSIDGYCDQVAVERKSYADLAQTLTHGRRRFVKELERLNRLTMAWVVCEVDFAGMMAGPPAYSQVNPKTLWRSVAAFQIRYPRVHWWLLPGREVAEAMTYRLLEKWWGETVRNDKGRSDGGIG